MPFLIIGSSLVSLFVIISIIYLILLYPSKNKKEETLRFASYRYAHRGLHGEGAPENSLAAFARAVERGCGIELDVRLSSDMELVVFHDDTLDRMTEKTGLVNAYTKDELTGISLAGTGETIPTLDSVLSLVSGKVPLLIEIKEAKGSLEVTRRVCERLKSYTGAYIIESFNPIALGEVRRLLPGSIVGILSEHFTKNEQLRKPLYYFLESMVTNVMSRPDFVAYNHKHAAFLPFRVAKMLGYVCFCYTVKSAEDEKKALEGDFDTVIFEGYIEDK